MENFTKQMLLEIVLLSIFGLFLMFVFYGWLSGCGEHYIDANGISHVYECMKE